MDLKDKKILGELAINSRVPINRLAKRVGLSREVVTYRINQLKSKNIITGFHAVINENTLGFERNTFFIQLKGISIEKEKEFLNFLKEHKLITYFGTVIGKWNVVFDIISNSRKQLETVINEIEMRAKNNLSIFAMAGNTISGGYYPEKIFGFLAQESKESKRNIKLDKTDLKILEILTINSRTEYSELSKKLNLTANAIKYRIKNLEKLNVIERYAISINVKKLGYSWYNIQAKSLTKEKKIEDFLKKSKQVIYHYHYLGNENWDVDLGIIVQDTEELRNFIIEFREKLSDSIKIHDVYIVLDVYKENILPKGVFE